LADLIGGRDDADLLVRLRRRDPQAVGILYDRYGKLAYSLAFRILGSPEAAESVVAEAVLKCWNRIASFKETRGCALGVWLLVVTYANALDHRRGPDSVGDENLMQPGALERGAIFQDWSKAVDTERVQESFEGLSQLNEEEKRILELAFFEGLNPAELTVRLGRPQAEVDKLIDSALSKVAFLPHE
jgi:RNA polymerase sigma-70 factor (ECF subfamily)